MVNRVTLVGTVSNAPESRALRDKLVTTFSLATESTWKDKVFKEFHTVVAYGGAAPIAAELRPGDVAAVEGSLQSRSYEPVDGGPKRRIVEVAATSVRRLALQPEEGRPQEDEVVGAVRW